MTAAPTKPVVSRPLAVLAVLLPVFVAGCVAVWSFTIDDAFITFRYSANLAQGDGPTWNPGADPVEGFTNFAWMAWHAAFAVLGLALPVVAKVTSVLLGLATLAQLVVTSTRAGGWTAAVVAGGTFVAFVPTYFHVVGGLETMAFAAVVLRMVVLGLTAVRGRPVRDWEPPLLFLLAGLLRPEGVLAALPALAVWLWHARSRPAARWWTGAAAAAGAGYFAWRWSYYGYPFPNTFYVKFGDLAAGEDWVWSTAAAFLPLLASVLVLLVRRQGLLIASTVAATYLAYALSGPSMDYVHRFAFHAFPVLCLAAGLAVAALRRWLGMLCGAVTIAWTALAGAWVPDLGTIADYGDDLGRAHVAIGKGLADAPVPERARSLAVSDAGAIPYYSGWTTTDYLGLNDEAVTHGADVTSVVRAAAPTVLVVTAPGPEVPDVAYGLRIPDVSAGYRHVAAVWMRQAYYQHVLVVPEWADAVRTGLDRVRGGT
ncbi:hypothetical protein [Amycolatopsis suaedae]|uniref:Glycosyltransferase RgtA/B/C/D-like domain-containing protein n=1 Tax=Amycolatopsis suaedae TaxID=2510978 RepID=A0A4Q7JDG2_9PSEU|nr:hypothetical protein [Amycolatopsis suaedae]RZQ64404.1 hypothetical protein EWH70_10615 [Amycolatopsis suaedae]